MNVLHRSEHHLHALTDLDAGGIDLVDGSARARDEIAHHAQVRIFVEGDGDDFDWGMDYTECGIVKFLRAQGAGDLAPYFCLADFPMSDAFGLGL